MPTLAFINSINVFGTAVLLGLWAVYVGFNGLLVFSTAVALASVAEFVGQRLLVKRRRVCKLLLVGSQLGVIAVTGAYLWWLGTHYSAAACLNAYPQWLQNLIGNYFITQQGMHPSEVVALLNFLGPYWAGALGLSTLLYQGLLVVLYARVKV